MLIGPDDAELTADFSFGLPPRLPPEWRGHDGQELIDVTCHDSPMIEYTVGAEGY